VIASSNIGIKYSKITRFSGKESAWQPVPSETLGVGADPAT
jgi:hypothetical protein